MDYQKQNTEIRAWGSGTLQQVKNKYMSAVRSPNRSGEGLENLRLQTKSNFGQVERISFRFNRYLVFLHKGAGKGKGGQKGSRWYNARDQITKTNPKSFGKMNTGRRSAKEWLNPVLDKELPKLADILKNIQADQVIKAIQIK